LFPASEIFHHLHRCVYSHNNLITKLEKSQPAVDQLMNIRKLTQWFGLVE